MKLKFILVAALAAVTLASCSKDDNPNKGAEGVEIKGSLAVRFEQPAVTRGISDPADNATTKLSYGAVILIGEEAGNQYVIRQAIIGNGPSYVNPTNGPIVFHDIDANLSEVRVYGNIPFTAGKNYTLTELDAIVLDMEDQWDDKFFVTNVAMYGESDEINAVDPLDNKEWDYEVDVEIAPVFTRLELGALEFTPFVSEATTPEGFDPGVKLEGIFINGLYMKVGIDGTVDEDDYFKLHQNQDDYALVDDGGKYENEWYSKTLGGGWLLDFPNKVAETAGSKLEITAGTGKVWGYNTSNKTIPHIILHLSGVGKNNQLRPNADWGTGHDGEGFVTINTYYEGNDLLLELAAGHVYTINAQEILYNDVIDYPEPDVQVCAQVTVSILPWEGHNVTGGIARD